MSDTVDGVATAVLHADAREVVTYHQLEPGAALPIDAAGGAELLMIAGTATEGADALRKGSWLRVPDGDTVRAVAGPDGARIWVKTGHLRYAAAPAV